MKSRTRRTLETIGIGLGLVFLSLFPWGFILIALLILTDGKFAPF